jgi:hypothetical protein
MRKVLFAVVLSFVFKVGFSHDYNLWSLGLNAPVKYHAKTPERKFGFEFGYSRGSTVNERFSIEGGVILDVWGEWKIKELYYYGSALNRATYSHLNFSFDFPIMANYSVGRWVIKSGVAASCKNLFWISKTDNDAGGSYMFHDSDGRYIEDSRSFGIDYRVAMSYALTDKVGLYANYKTTIAICKADYMGFKGNRYGLFNFGVAYRISCK